MTASMAMVAFIQVALFAQLLTEAFYRRTKLTADYEMPCKFQLGREITAMQSDSGLVVIVWLINCD